MREQRAEGRVDPVLRGELLHHFRAALGVRAVVLGDDLDLSPRDAAILIDQLARGGRRALVPAPVRRPDAGPVHLETEPDRFGGLRMGIARQRRQQLQSGRGAGRRAEPRQRSAPGDAPP
jgi:hypothetical protein